jgi:hypothetical protein
MTRYDTRVAFTHFHFLLSIIDDDDEALALCLVIILFGIVEAHTTRVRRRNVN